MRTSKEYLIALQKGAVNLFQGHIILTSSFLAATNMLSRLTGTSAKVTSLVLPNLGTLSLTSINRWVADSKIS